MQVDGDWVSGERVYNTGFAFLRFLKSKYGLAKVRRLAEPKAVFNFNYSAKLVFGKNLDQLYQEFKMSLADKYDDYKDLPKEKVFIKGGSATHSLAFSSNNRYIAWIDNSDRIYPIDWSLTTIGLMALMSNNPFSCKTRFFTKLIGS